MILNIQSVRWRWRRVCGPALEGLGRLIVVCALALTGGAVRADTRDFDRIWVGTETRDYADKQWGGTPPYEGYFIMRWLGGIGGDKCGGGWYDWLGTTEKTYQDGSWVLENFRDSSAVAVLNGETLQIPARGWIFRWK